MMCPVVLAFHLSCLPYCHIHRNYFLVHCKSDGFFMFGWFHGPSYCICYLFYIIHGIGVDISTAANWNWGYKAFFSRNLYCCAISLNTKHQSNHIVRFEQKLFISYKQLANRMDNNTFWFTLLIKCYKTTYSNSPRVCTSGIYLQYLQRFNSDLDDFTGYVVQSIQYPPHQFHQCILRRMIVSEM